MNYWAEVGIWEHFKLLSMQLRLAPSPAAFQPKGHLAEILQGCSATSKGLGCVLQGHPGVQGFEGHCVIVQVEGFFLVASLF